MGANRIEDRQVNFRVSEDEYQQLEQMANNLGMSVPAFCKAKVKSSKIKAPLLDRQGALNIASELRKTGVNVNQIAKHLNSGGNVSNEQINALQKELSEIWQLLSSALQGVRTD